MLKKFAQVKPTEIPMPDAEVPMPDAEVPMPAAKIPPATLTPSLPNTSDAPEAGTATSRTNITNTFYQQGTAPIKAMQQEMINLARNIASHNINNTSPRPLGSIEPDTLQGADPFMNFLVNNYMNSAKLSGQQVINVDNRNPAKLNTAKLNDNFKGVLQSITTIGSSGAEQRPDGNWGPKTNNGLKQIYALAYALMKVQHDMDMEVPSYTDADLNELYSNIPQDINININEKIKRASIINKNLKKFEAVYDNFRDKVLNDPNYSAHITQNKPLITAKKEIKNTNSLNEYDQRSYIQQQKSPLDVTLNGKPVRIAPINLYNMNNFKKYLSYQADAKVITPEELNAINKGDQATLNKFLIEIANELGKE